MTVVSEVVEFRHDLFFDGAVQIGWFENDIARRDKAASNFVFHGPEYHGVAANDISEAQGYRLTDTVSFTGSIVDTFDVETNQEHPISLAIAGYGTGKSHLALTLATVLSDPKSAVSEKILENLKLADPVVGSQIALKVKELSSPILVIPINGMGNFDLASELSRQALHRLNHHDLDTSAINDLWPRFKLACNFVERNFSLREKEFVGHFGGEIHKEELLNRLLDHDDLAYQHVNEIFEQANGNPLRAVGEESPTQLIETLCDEYCGPGKPFQSMLILFDEFGRFLEFAAERPHIAGDAALQQIYEGVQNNSNKCSLLCLNQYELKVYLSRISRDSQATIQRYITRYDSAKKYYLSSNLETLFAHLIKKNDKKFLSNYLDSSDVNSSNILQKIQSWFPTATKQSVWSDNKLFQQVIVQGCWPLHPLATWFLCRSSDFLQQRSAISFVADAFDSEKDHLLENDGSFWAISATTLCDSPLIKELVSVEEHGQGGAIAQSYEAVTQKYQHDLLTNDRHILLAVLIAAKLGLKVNDQEEAHEAFSALSNIDVDDVQNIVNELVSEYGVLEWNERFLRYEIIGDAVPRSTFLTFLRKRTQDISAEEAEEIFSAQGKAWAELPDIDPQFAAQNDISTSEWNYFTSCTHIDGLPIIIDNAITDWQNAVRPDENRGQLIYCYVRGDEKIDAVSAKVQKTLNSRLKSKGSDQAPILIVLFHDEENTIRKILTEYSVLSGSLPAEAKQKFSHFIEDHKSKLIEELKLSCEKLTLNRQYLCGKTFTIEKKRLSIVCRELFQQAYPDILAFPFDGFSTARGNAAKDCRLITTELLNGNLNHDWISTQAPNTLNRAKRLLKSWDVMGGDGQIDLYPRHTKFNELISSIEDQLKNEKLLNVGQLFEKLIAPPYGFNIASAGLIFGVFLAPRQDIAVLNVDEQNISSGAWISKAFSGNFLKFKQLQKTTIRYVSDSETGEWQQLLGRWDNETTHSGNLSYWENAQQLKERVSLPPGVLFERYTRLEEQSHISIKALQELENFYEKEAKFFEKFYKWKDAGNLSRVAKDLKQRLKTMEGQQELWVNEQLAPIQSLYGQVREAAIQYFDEWLPGQSCISFQKVPDFRRRMKEQICSNFRVIDLDGYANKVETYALKILSQIEDRQKVKYIVDQARAYLNSHQNRISSQSRVVELRQWMHDAMELVAPLMEARRQVDVPEIGTVLQQIDTFQKDCKKQIKNHEIRFGALWNVSLASLDGIRDSQREVGQLLTIFVEDKPENIDELRAMQIQLRQFEEDYLSWDDLTVSNNVLARKVEIRIHALLEEQDDEEELPWDAEEVCNDILTHLLDERGLSAIRWLDGVGIEAKQIKYLNARNCHLYMEKISNPPAYLNPEQTKGISQLRNLLTQRLSELQLDGVLEMFRNLPKVLQKEFVEIIISCKSK